MKITDIRMLRLQGPRIHGLGGETGGVSRVWILRIDSDSGHYGLAELAPWIGVEEALAKIRPMLLGRDPLAIRPIFSEILYGSLPPHPRRVGPDGRRVPESICGPTDVPSGPPIWALSGIATALCDLAGKALKTPAYNLLGGAFRDRIRIYLDRSGPADVADLEAWAEIARKTVARGFTYMKFDADFAAPDRTEDVFNRCLPTAQIDRIAERMTAVRQAVGPDVEVAIDCHMQFNVPDAVRLSEALSHLRLRWLEDPTPITSAPACAEVRRRSRIPICIGETFNAETSRAFMEAGACDILHPDVMYCGGMHEALRIGQDAELRYLPMAMHGNGTALATIAAAHVAAATRNFLALEYHYIESQWAGSYVRREGLPLFRDGHLPLSDAPGLGVELDEEVCRAHLAPGEIPF